MTGRTWTGSDWRTLPQVTPRTKGHECRREPCARCEARIEAAEETRDYGHLDHEQDMDDRANREAGAA